MHATLKKFGYPETKIRDFDHWAVVVRLAQPTLGSCVIISKSEATSIGDLTGDQGAEFFTVAKQFEQACTAAFRPKKFNYLTLMMVDSHVHVHALPRYEFDLEFAKHEFIDRHWPKPPVLSEAEDISRDQVMEIRQRLIDCWPQP